MSMYSSDNATVLSNDRNVTTSPDGRSVATSPDDSLSDEDEHCLTNEPPYKVCDDLIDPNIDRAHDDTNLADGTLTLVNGNLLTVNVGLTKCIIFILEYLILRAICGYISVYDIKLNYKSL